MDDPKRDDEPLQNNKNNPHDPRKNPQPGYDEKNPRSKKDIKNIQDNPGNQNTG